jgi:hypothetical protein
VPSFRAWVFAVALTGSVTAWLGLGAWSLWTGHFWVWASSLAIPVVGAVLWLIADALDHSGLAAREDVIASLGESVSAIERVVTKLRRL